MWDNTVSPSQTTETSDPTGAPAPLDESWFAEGERLSGPPPSSRRATPASSLPPPEPIGDRLADVWFR
jgi:hypothetical protein